MAAVGQWRLRQDNGPELKQSLILSYKFNLIQAWIIILIRNNDNDNDN